MKLVSRLSKLILGASTIAAMTVEPSGRLRAATDFVAADTRRSHRYGGEACGEPATYPDRDFRFFR